MLEERAAEHYHTCITLHPCGYTHARKYSDAWEISWS